MVLIKSTESSSIKSITLQSDNKFIVLSKTKTSKSGITRYFTNGKIDSSFNGTGVKLLSDISEPSKIVVQPDKKILVLGTGSFLSNDIWYTTKMKIVRLNEDGTTDLSFGNKGMLIPTTSDRVENAGDLKVKPDGKIVIVGSTRMETTSDDFMIIQTDSSGKLDNAFANKGILVYDAGSTKYPDGAASVAIQRDGKILIGGYKPLNSVYNVDPILIRVTTTGKIDSTFNTIGYYTFNNGGKNYDNIVDVEVQQDGKSVFLVASGNEASPKMFRLNTDGTRDNSFTYEGSNGTKFEIVKGGFLFVNIWSVGKLDTMGKLVESFCSDGYFRNPLPNSNNSTFIQLENGDLFIGGTYTNASFQSEGFILKAANIATSNREPTAIKSIVEIYPNPFTDQLTIKFPESIGEKTVTILDPLGKEVYKLKTTENSISVDDLTKGDLYIVRIQCKNDIIYTNAIRAK